MRAMPLPGGTSGDLDQGPSALRAISSRHLKGDRRGQYSIRINDQWRICFELPNGSSGPQNVEIVDYH